jgi:hypothetical protein
LSESDKHAILLQHGLLYYILEYKKFEMLVDEFSVDEIIVDEFSVDEFIVDDFGGQMCHSILQIGLWNDN